MKKIKAFPAILTLSAASICCVVSIFQKVSFHVFVLRLLCVVVAFLLVGFLAGMFLEEAFKVMGTTTETKAEEETVESGEDLKISLNDDEDDEDEDE